jgi:hypothetical protein
MKCTLLLILFPFLLFQDNRHFFVEGLITDEIGLPNRRDCNRILFVFSNGIKSDSLLSEFQREVITNFAKSKYAYSIHFTDTFNLKEKSLVSKLMNFNPNELIVLNNNGIVKISNPLEIKKFNCTNFISIKIHFYYINMKSKEIKLQEDLSFYIIEKYSENDKVSITTEMVNYAFPYINN